ncbi:MAG TPA: DUF1178 domain-containing protein [Rhodobiaceae bacterium]|nr:DUF1178 domain-containing protein [Rhodobiaceae bacterium]
MIKYRLICDQGHEFDGWFKCSAAFEDQCKSGQLSCAVCGSAKISKAIMAPALARVRGDLTSREDREKRALVDKLIDHVENDFGYVGKDFADEARKIHNGEAQAREIYGEATLNEARDLLTEGVPVAPLPKPPHKKD